MTDMRFAYKPKTLTMILAGGFFLLCAVALAFRAASNDRGLILNGIINLDQGGATTFYYVLAGLAALMSVGGFIGFVQSLKGPGFVVLDETGVGFPGNLGQKPVRIAYDAIKRLERGGAYRQRWLYIFHTGGRHAIMSSMLANAAQLDEIEALLAQRISR